MKRKIKDIYINRPWIAAFLCPFVIAIPAIILLGRGWLVMPLVWLFVGLFISKRKLPYILSLLLILFFVMFHYSIPEQLRGDFWWQ